MPHYKAPDNSIHFLDDAAHIGILPEGCVEMSDDEFAAYQAEQQRQAEPTLAMKAKAALNTLTAPGGTVMRCYMAGIMFPADWQAYRAELLAIANGTDTTSTALPPQPDYPAGT